MRDAFQALADPTRREILALLRKGPRSSGEIAAAFDSAWPTISRHLAVLREAGLVAAVKEGQHVRYELDTTVLQEVIAHLMEWTGKGGRRVER